MSILRYLAVLLAALAAPALAQPGVVKVDGSSTVYPITEAVARAYRDPGGRPIRLSVGISGTGGGFRKFCRGDTDISNASRPIVKAEMVECAANRIRYVEIPIAYDALTVVVHDKNSFLNSISIAELRRLWEPEAQGRITRWNQVNPAWPDLPILLYGPGVDSGTFDYFTEAVVGRPRASRRDYTASEDDNMLVEGVSRDAGALGYFGIAYYEEHRRRLRALPISNEPGQPAVAPTMPNVLNGAYRPLSRPLFIYVSEAALKRPEVRAFAEYYVRNSARYARQVKYVPLPDGAYVLGLTRLQKPTFGTLFDGAPEVGITIRDLMEREARP